jgi:hypothetical protein
MPVFDRPRVRIMREDCELARHERQQATRTIQTIHWALVRRPVRQLGITKQPTAKLDQLLSDLELSSAAVFLCPHARAHIETLTGKACLLRTEERPGASKESSLRYELSPL